MAGWLKNAVGRLTGRRPATPKPPVVGPVNQAIANDKVRAQLLKEGDDGSLERHVVHFAYPVDGAEDALSKDEIKDILSAPGLAFSESEDSAGIVFEMHREVASASFDSMTQAFADNLRELGWRYDGWECAVVKPGS